jgi:hypothetical protein
MPAQSISNPQNDRWWIWSNQWNHLQGKPKYSEETCPNSTLSTINPTWAEPELINPTWDRFSSCEIYELNLAHQLMWDLWAEPELNLAQIPHEPGSAHVGFMSWTWAHKSHMSQVQLKSHMSQVQLVNPTWAEPGSCGIYEPGWAHVRFMSWAEPGSNPGLRGGKPATAWARPHSEVSIRCHPVFQDRFWRVDRQLWEPGRHSVVPDKQLVTVDLLSPTSAISEKSMVIELIARLGSSQNVRPLPSKSYYYTRAGRLETSNPRPYTWSRKHSLHAKFHKENFSGNVTVKYKLTLGNNLCVHWPQNCFFQRSCLNHIGTARFLYWWV